MSKQSKIRFGFLFLLLAGASIVSYFLWLREKPILDDAPPDPRLTFDTPFRNVRPDVAYVGDESCVPCHAELVGSYHQHPMGRSATLNLVDGGMGTFQFSAYRHVGFAGSKQNEKIYHVETIDVPGGPIVTEAEIVAILGSGTRGKSYLCEREGSFWQSGASWFAEKPGWDASPGFWPGLHARRAVVPECLFCHVNRVESQPGTFNRYREPTFGRQIAIGCERCHGPGSIHVAERSANSSITGPIDTSIVNPRHLPAKLREDVCRQCHLQGEFRLVRRGREQFDFRPGLPLDLFLTVYLPHPDLIDYSKSVGQVEQTSISRCSAGSEGRFGCISCHDPHSVPAAATREEYYRGKCLSCHQDRGCSLPEPERLAKNNACTTCHMPKSASSNIVHTAVTDHRIMRQPKPGTPTRKTVPFGELPLSTLGGTGHWPEDDERARDLAVVLSLKSKLSAALLREVEERLRNFTENHRGDAEAWEALATVRILLGDGEGALKAAEVAVKARPDRERALSKAAEAALLAGKPEQALDYAIRAKNINPGYPDHRVRWGQALIDLGRYAEAERELRQLLAIVANHAQGRATLALSLYKQGRTREAVTELDRASAIYPNDSRELRNWFSTRTR